MMGATSARALGPYDSLASRSSANSDFGGAAENLTATYAFGEADGTGQLGLYQARIGTRQAGLKQPVALTASELTAQASKGCNLLYMMAASAEDALTRMQRNPASKDLKSSQSTWTNAGALKDNGWSDKKPGMTAANWAYAGIQKTVDQLGFKRTDPENLNILLTQDQPVAGYAVSKGTYNQFMNIKQGLVIPYYIYSPQHEMSANKIQGKAVALSRYSDILFLYWKKLCNRTTKFVPCPLKYFLFLNIENQQTWSTVVTVLGSNKLTEWPGQTFDMNSDQGKALLATQIGNPLAWLLIQHKEAFGNQIVTKVQVFKNTGATSRDTDTPYPNLLFYTGNAPKDDHCNPSDSCCCPTV
ncbi:hypothetical protein LTR95_008958 [Oleoguttula sp. CCFEE 5521]